MEALVPPDVLDVGDGDNHTARSYTLLEHAIDHTARSSKSAVPTTNYDAIAVPTTNSEQQFAACSLEWSTTAADCLPQSRSSLARTAPTRGDGGQCAPGQRATTRQRAIPRQWAPGQRATTGQRATPRQCATPQRTSEWMITLTAIGSSLSSSKRLWLDFAIMSIEQLLNALRTIRAAYREPAIVGRDASAAAAVAQRRKRAHRIGGSRRRVDAVWRILCMCVVHGQ